MYHGQELSYIPDQKVKVGTEVPGSKPNLKAPIKGMTLDAEIDITAVKNFCKFDGDNGDKWVFNPQVGDEGVYNMSLVVKLYMQGQPTQKVQYDFKVTIWDDPKLNQS